MRGVSGKGTCASYFPHSPRPPITKLLLDELGLWMASDMIRACRNIVENRTGDWLETWDAMPVGELQFITHDLSGVVSQRHALGGMVYERLYRRFGPNSDQLDLLHDRRRMP